jgi:hypothetical protein
MIRAPLGGPDAELGALLRFDTVADRDNHIKIVVIRRLLLKFGNSEFLHNLAFDQFPFGEDILDMFVNGGFGLAEQLRHMLLRQPDGLVLQMHIDSDLALLVLINENFGVIHRFNASRMGSWYLPSAAADFRR